LWLGGSEITYTDNQLNLGRGLAANSSTTLKVQIEDDNFVEPAEELSIGLDSANSPYVASINDNDATTLIEQIFNVNYIIPIQDVLTVTVSGSGTSANEAGDAQGVTNPFTYVTDKAIAPNTPTLEMTLEDSGCSELCATSLDYDLPSTQKLHSNRSPSAAVTTAKNLGLLIKSDNIVESDELINSQLSSNNSAYVQFSGEDTQNLSYTILNVDTLNLVITDITDTDSTCGGFAIEDGCKLYDITWDNGTDSALGAVNMALNTTDSSTNMLYAAQTNALDANMVEDPKDYTLAIDGGELTGTSQIPLGEGLAEEGNALFKVTLENDNFVELAETLTLKLSAADGSDIINSLKIDNNAAVLNSANAGYAQLLTYAIPFNADLLSVNVSTVPSAPEPGDTDTNNVDGVAQPFSYTTSYNVAASVPSITLTVARATCVTGDTCATLPDDFTLPTAIPLHSNLSYTPAITQTNLGVTVQSDNIIEASELIKLALSVNAEAVNYVATLPSPQHTITNGDALNLTITDNTDDNASCSGFSGETASCRSYNVAWENILQSGAAAIAITAADDNVAARATSYDLEDVALEVDPKDYSISVGGSEVPGLITLANEDSDGDVNTNSMVVKVNIEEDDFVEPAEKLNIFFSTSGSTINSIVGFNGAGAITHTIPLDDTVTVTIQGGSTAANEPIYDSSTPPSLISGTANPFTYTLVNNIAANTPTQTLRINKEDCDSSPCATKTGADQDFTVSGIITIHSMDTFTPEDVATDLGVTILPDDVVEMNEEIKVRVREQNGGGSAFIANFAGTKIEKLYTINNNDKTTLSITNTTATHADEGDSGTPDITYYVNSSAEISSDVPDLFVDITLSASSTASPTGAAADVTVPATLKFHTGSGLAANTDVPFTVDINVDTTVEQDETVIPTITLASGLDSATYTQLHATATTGRVHTIDNDDKTVLSITALSNTSASEGDSGTLNITYTVNSSLKIDSSVPVLSIDITNGGSSESGSSDSGDILIPASLQIHDGDGLAANANLTFDVVIKGDKKIEQNETVIPALTLQEDSLAYTQLHGTNFTGRTHTISNDDFLTVSSKNYNNQITDINDPDLQQPTDQLQEGGQYALEFCLPTGYTIQTGNNLSFNMTLSASIGTNSKVLLGAVCADVSLSDGISDCTETRSKEINLDSLTAVNPCTDISLINITDDNDANQNKSFFAEFITSDARILGSNVVPIQSLTILNDDLINVLDTGLDECVENGTTMLWDVPCTGENSHVPDADHNPNYQYQDGAVTEFYPELTYTYINESGKPVQELPTGTGSQICLQDNSTGLIWSESSELTKFSDGATLNECGLAITGRTWQLPTVQELITIIDLDPLSHLKPLHASNILALNKTGSDFWQHKSRYWTKDSCFISTPSEIAGKWAVDFISGHVECIDTSTSGIETNFFIKVYK
jgi:hypothetical protein